MSQNVFIVWSVASRVNIHKQELGALSNVWISEQWEEAITVRGKNDKCHTQQNQTITLKIIYLNDKESFLEFIEM